MVCYQPVRGDKRVHGMNVSVCRYLYGDEGKSVPMFMYLSSDVPYVMGIAEQHVIL